MDYKRDHDDYPGAPGQDQSGICIAFACSEPFALFVPRLLQGRMYLCLLTQAPEICALYPLDIPPAMLRAKMRTLFEQNRHVRDVAVLDVLLLKGQQEYQETMNAWKQTSHVMKWFAEEEVRWTFC